MSKEADLEWELGRIRELLEIRTEERDELKVQLKATEDKAAFLMREVAVLKNDVSNVCDDRNAFEKERDELAAQCSALREALGGIIRSPKTQHGHIVAGVSDLTRAGDALASTRDAAAAWEAMVRASVLEELAKWHDGRRAEHEKRVAGASPWSQQRMLHHHYGAAAAHGASEDHFRALARPEPDATPPKDGG
jgi:chromosome segregation ATPase